MHLPAGAKWRFVHPQGSSPLLRAKSWQAIRSRVPQTWEMFFRLRTCFQAKCSGLKGTPSPVQHLPGQNESKVASKVSLTQPETDFFIEPRCAGIRFLRLCSDLCLAASGGPSLRSGCRALEDTEEAGNLPRDAGACGFGIASRTIYYLDKHEVLFGGAKRSWQTPARLHVQEVSHIIHVTGLPPSAIRNFSLQHPHPAQVSCTWWRRRWVFGGLCASRHLFLLLNCQCAT